MYSFVIKIDIEVNKAVLDDKTTPILIFNIAFVLELIVETDPIKFSVITNKFFYLNFCTSSHINHQF